MPPKRIVLSLIALTLLLHGYLGWRLLPPLCTTPGMWLGGILLLTLSSILLPAGLLARGLKRQPWADLLSWIGLTSMGLFSSLLCLSLLRDLLLLALWLPGAPGLAHLRSDSALALLLLALGLTLYGLYNARRLPRVREVEVALAGLAPALQGFCIVQISDVHVGPTIKRGYLQPIIDRANRLDADMIALTGDLVDGSVRQLAAHTAPFAELRARYGVFYVTGNHEYYCGAEEWQAEFRRLGLQVLENRHVLLEHQGARLLVAGVSDYSAQHFAGGHASDPHAALAGAPADLALKLLLAHQPRSAFAAADAGFDLQLSGHTHGGQFVPWNWLVPLQQPFTSGLHRLRGLWVYTSRGTGYWGPPLRLWAPSEITCLRLVRQAED